MKLTKIQGTLIFTPIILLIFLFIAIKLGNLNIFSNLLYHPFLGLLLFILIIVGVFRFLLK